jgi:glycosyltransferase involved in cell wall biosynthesis
MSLSLSIVTPSYNQGRFIERTLLSVLDQGVPLEYVVFDGGSQDETMAILKKYTGRLRWVSEKDRGQAHAINKGLAATRGEVIGWLNSDDVYYPGALKTVLDYFEAHPAVDLLYGDADHIDEQDAFIEAYPTAEWDLAALRVVCFICQPAAFFRRRVVERFGPLNDALHFCLDYEYWLRIGQGGGVVRHLPVKLAGSRLYPQTKTLGSRQRFHSEINSMLLARLGRVPDKWLFNYAHAVLDERGLPRSARLRFAAAVSMLSLWAGFKWNHSVSPQMWATCRSWVAGNLRARG